MVKKKDVVDDLELMRSQMLDRRLEKLAHVARNRQKGVTVVMEDVHNPYNLNAIARTCESFGIQDICFTLQDEKLFNPKKIGRAVSGSANKWLDYRIFENGIDECVATLKEEEWFIVATVATDDALSIYDLDFTAYEKVAILIGNEHQGLSTEAIQLADTHATIPMYGMTQSFNVSVAAAIILAEVTRQRRLEPDRFLITQEEAEKLNETLIRRSYLTKLQHRFSVNPDDL